MKKILLIVIIVVFVPFLIVNSYKIQKVKEIKLNYESNYFIRVKRTSTNEIQNIPFEEYIVGVLAGEMPISFEKEAFKAQAVAARSYALNRILYNKDNDLNVNPCKEKKLTNMRASGKDEALTLRPILPMTLEKAIHFIADDEMVEVTPHSVRIRKTILSAQERHTLRGKQLQGIEENLDDE